MIVEENKVGETTIRIHDDYIRSKDESEKLLQKIADNVLVHIIRTSKEKTA